MTSPRPPPGRGDVASGRSAPRGEEDTTASGRRARWSASALWARIARWSGEARPWHGDGAVGISTCPAVVQVAVTVVETGRDHRQAIDVADEGRTAPSGDAEPNRLRDPARPRAGPSRRRRAGASMRPENPQRFSACDQKRPSTHAVTALTSPATVPQAMKSRATSRLNPGPVFVALHTASPPDTRDTWTRPSAGSS